MGGFFEAICISSVDARTVLLLRGLRRINQELHEMIKRFYLKHKNIDDLELMMTAACIYMLQSSSLEILKAKETQAPGQSA